MTRPIRAAGPMSTLAGQQTTISRVLVLLGIVVLLIVVANRLARRVGGWYFVRRRVRREVRLTTAAFAAPVRGWLRYRRRLRLLTRLLADPAVWQAGERAMRSVDAVTPTGCRPYATVVGADLVGVFIAGLRLPEPPDPWIADGTDPNLWWSVREAWNGPSTGGEDPAGRPVLLTALGSDGARAVFLDLTDGPPVTALYGDEQATGALLQAMAAQLDRRLPPGAVTVAQGVHPHHAGPSVAQAVEGAAGWRDEHDVSLWPAFAVCAEPLPEPVGLGGPFVLMRGRAHGRARLLTVDRNGLVVVHGTPLRPEATALPRAVARAIGSLPPHRPLSGRTVRAAGVGGPPAAVPAPEEAAVLGRSASAYASAVASGSAATAADPAVSHITSPTSGGSLRPQRSASAESTRSTGVSAAGDAPPVERPAAHGDDREEPPRTAAPSPTGVSASADAAASGPPDTTASSPGDGD